MLPKLWWIIRGKPMQYYDGFHCGCCGKWIMQRMVVPDYLDIGLPWGLCDDCICRMFWKK